MSLLHPSAKEDRPDVRDLLSDLQDISDSERKTSSAESSTGTNDENADKDYIQQKAGMPFAMYPSFN